MAADIGAEDIKGARAGDENPWRRSLIQTQDTIIEVKNTLVWGNRIREGERRASRIRTKTDLQSPKAHGIQKRGPCGDDEPHTRRSGDLYRAESVARKRHEAATIGDAGVAWDHQRVAVYGVKKPVEVDRERNSGGRDSRLDLRPRLHVHSGRGAVRTPEDLPHLRIQGRSGHLDPKSLTLVGYRQPDKIEPGVLPHLGAELTNNGGANREEFGAHDFSGGFRESLRDFGSSSEHVGNGGDGEDDPMLVHDRCAEALGTRRAAPPLPVRKEAAERSEHRVTLARQDVVLNAVGIPILLDATKPRPLTVKR